MWLFSYSKIKMKTIKEIIHADRVYKQGFTGRNIKVALLDTGVQLHPDIKRKIRLFKDYVKGISYCHDDNGHGTHIAGIICGDGTSSNGRIKGIAPSAEIFVFKILDDKGDGRTEDALKALDWLLEYHKKYQIRILNFSMGYRPQSNLSMQEKLIEKLEQLWDEGVIVVTAAGNNGPGRNTITVPGISRKLITVGACGRNYEYGDLVAEYSGRGPTVCCIVKPEILAPGTDIVSLAQKGNGYTKKSGTSMAVPIVCGGLALALEKRKDISPEGMKILLYNSVEKIKFSPNLVWGILNVDKLMEMI